MRGAGGSGRVLHLHLCKKKKNQTLYSRAIETLRLVSRPGKRRRCPPVPAHRGRRRGAAGSGEAAGTRRAPAGGPEAEVGTRFSAFPAAAGRSPPYPLQASAVLPGLRPLRASPGPGPVAAAGGAAAARHGGAPGWGVQHPRSSPLHPGAGRVNASVQGVGSFH